MESEQKRIKGRIILGYVNYIRRKWGIKGLEEAQKGIGFKLSDVAQNKWYPYSNAEEIAAWLVTARGHEEAKKAGAMLVTENGVIMAYAKEKGFNMVLESISQARENSNFGSLVIKKEPSGTVVTVKEFCTNEGMCASWQGTLEGVIKISNVKGRVDRLSGDISGDGSCVFKITLDR